LCSYIESILTIKQFPNADPAKGKIVVSWDVGERPKGKKREKKALIQQSWIKPPEHSVKLIVDGSFCGASSTSGIGMVLREDDGSI
jgi:hypothetical protein